MMDLLIATGPALIASALFIAIFFVALLWLISLAVKDSSIVDFSWSFTCVAVCWIAYAVSDKGMTPRVMLVLAAVTIWGVRLGLYIARRNWGAEDRRYASLRKRAKEQGRNYAFYSLRVVFMFQGTVAWINALPLMAAIAGPGPAQPGVLTWIGTVVWLIGFVTESMADAQMARFRATRTRPDELMDRGLWRYSRHPNYFGEMLVQWGYFLFACDVGAPALITIVGPLLLTYLIVGPMGANLLERRLGKKKPAYADYVRRTSAFVPWPPSRLGRPLG
jgi:steroid 5-alpha reductase family enzyme